MTNLECFNALQMRAGLGRGSGREVFLTFGSFLRGRVGGSLRAGVLRCVHLRLGRRFRRPFVGLVSHSDHLAVHKFVTIGMVPDAVDERPAWFEWRRRHDFERGFGFLLVL